MKTRLDFKRTSTYRFVLCLGVACAVTQVAGEARASIVASHSGSADPTTEGWTANPFGGGVPVGPIVDEGTPAWFVDDTNSTAGYFYRRNVTALEVVDAATIGWTLTTTLRVPSSERAGLSASPFVAYSDGVKIWHMGFDVVAGATVVQLVSTFSPDPVNSTTNGPRYMLSGPSAYNTFELRFDPGSATADLFIDGVERISDHAGWVQSDIPSVNWGAGSSTDIGLGHFNAVSFTIAPVVAVPEAGAIWIWGLGTAMVSICALRKADSI